MVYTHFQMYSALLISIWLLHLLQVFTPETGFDALWYHLPVAQAMVEHGGLVYIPGLYQSVNPLFSDLFFTVGYMFGGALGTKVVAYLFGLATLWVSFLLSKRLLKGDYVWWSVICISLIHTIAWQSASFYVDVAKAFWELGAIYMLIVAIEQRVLSTKLAWLVGLLIGASVGTKAFSIILIPFFACSIWIYSRSKDQIKNTLMYVLGILLLSGPFYLHTFIHTGEFFYSISHHIGKLNEIGGNATVLGYIMKRLVELPLSPIALLVSRDYVSPMLVACIPILISYRKHIQTSQTFSFLTTFVAYQWLIWWFVPPTSTRYALSGFIVLVILVVWGLEQLSHGANRGHAMIINGIFALAVLTTLIPRLFVTVRSIQYIRGTQTQKEYLELFRDGHIDQHMDRWYGMNESKAP